jgi:hypothetical protein
LKERILLVVMTDWMDLLVDDDLKPRIRKDAITAFISNSPASFHHTQWLLTSHKNAYELVAGIICTSNGDLQPLHRTIDV